ncbi:MAG: DUF1877 family protein [Myxococcota bacterium]
MSTGAAADLIVTLTDAERAALRHGPGAALGEDDPRSYALEEASVGVHFLISGSVGGGDGPLAFLASAASDAGEPGVLGDARGRVLGPETVAAVADAIESLSAKLVRQRLVSDALRALPPFAGRALDDEDKEWLLAVLQGLMTFMRQAARARASLWVAAR